MIQPPNFGGFFLLVSLILALSFKKNDILLSFFLFPIAVWGQGLFRTLNLASLPLTAKGSLIILTLKRGCPFGRILGIGTVGNGSSWQ